MNIIHLFLSVFFGLFLQAQEWLHSNVIHYRAGMHSNWGQEPKRFRYQAVIYPNLPVPTINVLKIEMSINNRPRFGTEIQLQIARNLSLYFIHQHPHIQNFTLNILDHRGLIVTKNTSVQASMTSYNNIFPFDGKNNNWRGIFDARETSSTETKKRKFSSL